MDKCVRRESEGKGRFRVNFIIRRNRGCTFCVVQCMFLQHENQPFLVLDLSLLLAKRNMVDERKILKQPKKKNNWNIWRLNLLEIFFSNLQE